MVDFPFNFDRIMNIVCVGLNECGMRHVLLQARTDTIILIQNENHSCLVYLSINLILIQVKLSQTRFFLGAGQKGYYLSSLLCCTV